MPPDWAGISHIPKIITSSRRVSRPAPTYRRTFFHLLPLVYSAPWLVRHPVPRALPGFRGAIRGSVRACKYGEDRVCILTAIVYNLTLVCVLVWYQKKAHFYSRATKCRKAFDFKRWILKGYHSLISSSLGGPESVAFPP